MWAHGSCRSALRPNPHPDPNPNPNQLPMADDKLSALCIPEGGHIFEEGHTFLTLTLALTLALALTLTQPLS